MIPWDISLSSVFLQKKMKRLVLIDGICSGQCFCRTFSYKTHLRIGKAAWTASITNLQFLADARCSPKKQIWWHFKVWPHLLFSSGSLRNDTEVFHNTFLPRNVFLRNRFLTARRHWKTRWTSIPPCPLTAAHSPLVSRRTQKADPVFTLEWELPCQHHGYHPETGPMWKTSCWHTIAQQGGTFQRAAFHTTRVSNVLRDCRPLCPASFWIHFKPSFFILQEF